MLVENVATSGTLAHFFSVAVFGTPLFQRGRISSDFGSFLEILEAMNIDQMSLLRVKIVSNRKVTKTTKIGQILQEIYSRDSK